MHWKRQVGGDRFGGTQWWSLFLCIIIMESKYGLDFVLVLAAGVTSAHYF